jgi:hypothetical protein
VRAANLPILLLVGVLGLLPLCAAAADPPNVPYEIGKSNVERYAALLPSSIAHRVELGQYQLKVVPVDTKRFRANYTERFWKASAANAGKYDIDSETGGLVEVSSGKIPERLFGLPFPTIDPADPQAGAKVIHNYRMRKMQADGNLHEFDLSDVKLDGEVLRTVKISPCALYVIPCGLNATHKRSKERGKTGDPKTESNKPQFVLNVNTDVVGIICCKLTAVVFRSHVFRQFICGKSGDALGADRCLRRITKVIIIEVVLIQPPTG